MALSPFIEKMVENKLGSYCEHRVPPEVRDEIQLLYKFRGNTVTLYQKRRHLRNPKEWVEYNVAQFRYDPKGSSWSLYCRDRNAKWHRFTPAPPSKDIDELIQEVHDDHTGIFWG